MQVHPKGSSMEISSLFAFDTMAGRGVDTAVLLALASLVWWLARRRAERFRATADRGGRANAVLTRSELGSELGTTGSFVQFSARTCATCPQVHRLLAELAAGEAGVVHVELMAQEHMDLVRRLAVFRTPTVLLLDGSGAVRARMSGTLTRASAFAALDALTPAAPRSIDA